MNISKSIEKILEEGILCGELKLPGRRIKELPKIVRKLNLRDTVLVDLSKNRFSELPEDVCSFPFLEKLIIYHNVIKNIPETICNLHSLQYLDLRNNQLQSLPKEICFLPLKILLLSNNRLSSLPEEIGRLDTLTELDAAYNQIGILPVRMPKNLRALNLRNNQLVYLPRDISALPLTVLDVSSNRISVLPPELRTMTSLISLDVSNNPLTSPPASRCVHGLVHIFKYLEMLANKDEKLENGKRVSTPKHVNHAATIPQDGIDKRRQPNVLPNLRSEIKSESAAVGMQVIHNKDTKINVFNMEKYSPPKSLSKENNNSRENSLPGSPSKIQNIQGHMGQIQTYKEYKEALKQQREIVIYKSSKDNMVSPTGNTSPADLNGSSSPTQISLSQIPSNIPTLRSNGHSTSNGNGNNLDNGNITNDAPYVKPCAPKTISITTTSSIATPGSSTSKKLSKTVSWTRDIPGGEKKNFTMRREFDRQKEESELISQLRQIIKSRLKINLPEDLASALQDGVVLCHLANHVKPRSVASIHVPSATTPKLTVTRCRRNVDNFLDACRRIGVDDKLICCAADILEGRGVVQVAITVVELLKFHSNSGIKSPTHSIMPLRTKSLDSPSAVGGDM